MESEGTSSSNREMGEGSGDTAEVVGIGMKVTLQMIRAKFSTVPQMSTDDLSQLITSIRDGKSDRTLILLDVRSRQEYKVSHLLHGISVNPNLKDINQVIEVINAQVENPDDLKTALVVAYCSVGYRSSSIIRHLMEELAKPEHQALKYSMELFNLEGSIFKWANEKRKIVNSDNERTIYVHPYNVVWGKMLNYELRSYEPK